MNVRAHSPDKRTNNGGETIARGTRKQETDEWLELAQVRGDSMLHH